MSQTGHNHPSFLFFIFGYGKYKFLILGRKRAKKKKEGCLGIVPKRVKRWTSSSLLLVFPSYCWLNSGQVQKAHILSFFLSFSSAALPIFQTCFNFYYVIIFATFYCSCMLCWDSNHLE